MLDELLELRNQEDAIRDQADTWYRRWLKSLDRHGHEDEYWSRVIQIGEDFADKHGDCGKYLIIARMQLIEKVWRERLKEIN